MYTKSRKILGNYLGWVVNTSPDPGGRMRVQVFIPHLTNTIYSSWNKNLTNRAFRNPNELGTETLTLLQQVLPWAECAMPVFGGGTSMKANGTTGIVNVNGGSTTPYTPDTVAGMPGAGVTVPSNAIGPSTETLAPMPDTSSDGTIWDDVQQPLIPDQSLGGPPTNSNYAVLLAGSNDTDPTTAAANVVNAIKLLQSQGKNVIVVPPSTQQGNVNSAVGQAIIDAASKWTTVETGLTYKGPGQDPWPYKHLSSGSAKYLLDAYGADAFYVGDSNTEEMQLIGVDPNNIFGFRGKQSGYIYEQLQGRFGQTGDEPLPPVASPVNDAAKDRNKTDGLDKNTTGTGTTDPQAANFQVDPRTRDLLLKAGIKSTPGNRLVSLDYQDAGSSIGIVIPNNYTQAELNEAIKSVNSFKSWLAEFGINRELATTEPYGGGKTIAPGVYLTTHVSAGGVSRFHTEFFSQTDTQIMNLVQNNTASPNSGATYAQILAGTAEIAPVKSYEISEDKSLLFTMA
jgi:hypothetical protein